MEIFVVQLNSVLVSNNLLLALLTGAFTGIIAVLIEKIYLYRVHKNTLREWLYGQACMLYAEIYYWHCNIEELQDDKTKAIPPNLFSNKINMVTGILLNIVYTDYAVLFGTDNLLLEHTTFKTSDWIKIKRILDEHIYLDIALKTAELKCLNNKAECLENQLATGISEEIYNVKKDYSLVYATLKAYNTKLKNVVTRLDEYIVALQKDNPRKYDWERDKKRVHSGYIGIYTCSLDEFIRNSNNQND